MANREQGKRAHGNASSPLERETTERRRKSELKSPLVNSWMDDAWERVVEAALDGQGTRSSELRVLNLDGAVKSLHGCLPPAGILERFPCLEHLSIANVGVFSLEKFPRLRNLQRLILSDNRIAGGLDNLVQAGLHSLRDLDLSNNRIQYVEDLAPLANLHLVSLDLYECPVTKVNDYRSKVFSMIRTLKYLDKLDANEDERPETDEEEEEEEYDYDDFDPGCGEVDGDDRAGKLARTCGDFADVDDVIVDADVDDVIVDADEDEESDADEVEMVTSERGSVSGFSIESAHHLSNEFRVGTVGVISVDGNQNDAREDVEVEDDDGEDDDDLGEEIDEEDWEDTDVVDVHYVFDSDEDDDDGVDDVEDEVDIDEEDEDEDLEEEDEVDVDEYEVGMVDEEETEPCSSSRFISFEEEIDGNEHGEQDEHGEIGLYDENGEVGEEDELRIEDRDIEEDFSDGEDEDDLDGDYVVQPVTRSNGSSQQSNFNVCNEKGYFDSEDDNNQQDEALQSTFYNSEKRRRDDEGDLDDDNNIEELRLSKRR